MNCLRTLQPPTLSVPRDLLDEFPLLERGTPARPLRSIWMAEVAALAAAGRNTLLRTQVANALNVGVGREELAEIVYWTACQAGLPRAIEAARTLSALFAERWEAGQPIN
ncbi:MAG: carboxymuconolactone decarboxylase family protein [Sphingobium sp.]